jgi:hypothetical protein
MKFSRKYRQPSSNLLTTPRIGVVSHQSKTTHTKSSRFVLILAMLVVAFAGTYQTASAQQSNETIYGITSSGNQLVSFNSNDPNVILTRMQVTGLLGGEVVIKIDFRPATGVLYGLTNYDRLVTINTSTAVATPVASLAGLSGGEYGIDFNPVADRLRIVNTNDQNASVDSDTGAVTLQTPLNPGNPNIVSVAYTNNDTDPNTGTTLYDIDSNTDSLYIQNPPASGTLTLVGALGINTGDFVGFDISRAGVAYATLSNPATNNSSLYTINLQTGAATLIGPIANGTTSLRDIAVSPTLPPIIFGITSTGNQLITFNAARPEVILSSVVVSGLLNGEVIMAIDFRPANNQLYGLTSYNRVVTINTATGAATLVGTPNALNGNEYGFDFNPVPDRIRVVNDNDQNVRLNPDTGATAATDTPLAYAAGDPNAGQNPNVVGAAYTNSVTGATSTTLYDIDSNLDILVTQGGLNSNPSPNNGQLFTVGSLGVDTNNLVGFDISGKTGAAYASLSSPGTNNSSLYAINLQTGAASLIGPIGGGQTSLRGIAISTLTSPTIFGVTVTNKLVQFNADNPNGVSAPVQITGLLPGEVVYAIDFRPATGQLYGFTNYSQLVIINQTTGAATILGSPTGFNGSNFGFDFNPVPDRIRVVDDTEKNARVNPNDGTLTAIDGNLTYQAGDPLFGTDPSIVGTAYTNSFSGATSTRIYLIDSRFHSLATMDNPNSGIMRTVAFFDFAFSELVGFDIDPTTNAAYASLQPEGGGPSQLYAVNLAAGVPNAPNRGISLGTIGGGEPIRGIAIAPGSGTIQFASTGTTVTEGTDFSVTIPVTRTGDTSSAATVSYTTQAITAAAGANNDYIATSGTLTFAPGETTKEIVVQIVNNATAEPTETFNVVLGNPTGAALGSPSTFVVTILDND